MPITKAPDEVVAVRLSGNARALQKLLLAHPNEPQSLLREGDRLSFDVVVPRVQLPVLSQRFGVGVQLLSDLGLCIAGFDDVGAGNRFADASVPAGRGSQPGQPPLDKYYNVDEADSALRNLADAHPALCTVLELSQPTFEGRTCRALRMAAPGDVSTRPTVVLLGCLHGREWGSAEILLNFAADVLAATDGIDLAYGPVGFQAAQVQAMLDRLAIVMLPVGNPDGRHHSQTQQLMWRKNRRPLLDAGGRSLGIGVDINRNFDFVFDLARCFDASSCVSASTDPSDFNVYQGPGPFSEAESRNVRELLELHPGTRWWMDLHSSGPTVLYPWGDDDPQSEDPSMNFANPAWDGKRGLAANGYAEYLPPGQFDGAQKLAKLLADAASSVHQHPYAPFAGSHAGPIPGTSHDWATSVARCDPARPPLLGFALEWGDTYQPCLGPMTEVVEEVSAALVRLCLEAAALS